LQPLFVCCVKAAQFNKIVICTQRDGNNQIEVYSRSGTLHLPLQEVENEGTKM